MAQEQPSHRTVDGSLPRERLSFLVPEFLSAVRAGSDRLVRVQGSSGHGSILASQSQKSAELPWTGAGSHPGACRCHVTQAGRLWVAVLGSLPPMPAALGSFPAAQQGHLSGNQPSPAGTAWVSKRHPNRFIFYP